MHFIDDNFLDEISGQAKSSNRLRQHYNLHLSYDEPCQRILNAIEPKSYIRPHRHTLDPKTELLCALRGKFLTVLFNDEGEVSDTFSLLANGVGCGIAIELDPGTWHTVISLQSGSVLLEVKTGPFDPLQAKEYPIWAPAEDSNLSKKYFDNLVKSLGI